MSKTLWHTIKLEVPKEMVNITKSNKVVVKKSLTKTNNISKSNKEPSIKIIPGDTNKAKIIDNGKEWNIEELKLKMKKAKDLGKKNEGKEYKKKSDNVIVKDYVKKVNDKVLEKKEKKEPIQTNSKSQIDDVVNVWNTPEIPMILSLYDEETYNKIQNIIIRENNKNFHVFTPDLLAFTKKI